MEAKTDVWMCILIGSFVPFALLGIAYIGIQVMMLVILLTN